MGRLPPSVEKPTLIHPIFCFVVHTLQKACSDPLLTIYLRIFGSRKLPLGRL